MRKLVQTAEKVKKEVKSMRNKFKEMIKWIVAIGAFVLAMVSEPKENVLGAVESGSWVYETEDYSVNFVIQESWNDFRKVRIDITNVSDSPIENWSIATRFYGDITEMWNAKTCAQVYDLYVIKNDEHNQDILPGESVSFGMIIKVDPDFTVPEEFVIPMKSTGVDADNFMVEIVEVKTWDEGCSGSIVITNLSDRVISDWELTIGLDVKIESVWNGVIIGEETGNYIIGNMSYNQNIKPGESVFVGFLGEKTDDVVDVIECAMTEVVTAEVIDNLVSEENFADLITITDEYCVSAIYNLEDDVVAYYIQYFDEMGNDCSYIVVNNEVNSKETYYIEFGQGEASVIAYLCAMYEEIIGREDYKVVYLGGYNYYIKDDNGVYGINEDGLCEISIGEIESLARVSSMKYYNEYETLVFEDIEAKEAGYATKTSYKRTQDPSIYITTSDVTEDYKKMMEERDNMTYSDEDVPIDDHCAPTAAVNMLIFLTSQKYPKIGITKKYYLNTFISLYEIMETGEGGTTLEEAETGYQKVLKTLGYSVNAVKDKNVKWDKAIECIKMQPVHLHLIGSQIYSNHAVVGVGYVSYAHSSGWESKYFQIIDGWTRDYRYVNYSLGVDKIHMIQLKF